MSQHLLLDKLRAQTDDDTAEFTWLGSDGKEEETITGVEIYRRAGAVAHMLVDKKLKPGDRAMIAYPPGLDFLAALIGCARAGVICCSVYPPDPAKLKKSFAHFCTFAKDAGTDYVLTTSTMKKIMQGAALLYGSKGLKFIVTDSATKGSKTPFQDVPVSDKDIMFIQYSSGSTGTPKGVMISHGALVRNIELMKMAAGTKPDDRTCCWLPQYHDYGLVCNYLQALHLQTKLLCMSPFTFLRNPLTWANTLTKYNVNHTCGPNFAYALLHRKWLDAGKPHWNLSELRNASIAAEPITPSTIQKMIEMGIGHTAIHPSYGLAENVILATSDLPTSGPTIHDGRVSCGKVSFGTKRIHINEDEEIFVQGDDLASGYWNLPDLTQETFHNKLPGLEGAWLSTGDLGFIHDGLLYVTGRKKELIKVRGKNFFPTDIEADVEKVFSSWLRPGCSAAFQHTDASIGYVAEVKDEKSMPDTEKISQHILAEHGIQCTYIKLVPKGSTPKTTSGKIKRVECQKLSQESVPVVITQTLDVDEIVKAIDTGESKTLDMDKTFAENGVDSIKQVQVEQALASSRSLTDKHIEMLRSGSSLRNIKDEITNTSTIRLRNIECDNVQESIRTYQSIQISTTMRILLMGIVNILNLSIPLMMAGFVYDFSIIWGAVLVWVIIYTCVVAVLIRIFTFKGRDNFFVHVNSLAYVRWYVCVNNLKIWNVLVGTWIVGTIPYNIFLYIIGVRISVFDTIVETTFEYVDARLKIKSGARIYGICDTTAHKSNRILRFGPVHIGKHSTMCPFSRVWPGTNVGESSTIGKLARLYFDESCGSNLHVHGKYPSFAEPYKNASQYASVLGVNVVRMFIIPCLLISFLIIIGIFVSLLTITNTFWKYCFLIFGVQILIVLVAPLLKRFFIDVVKSRNINVEYMVNVIGVLGYRTFSLFICPGGGPLWIMYLNSFGSHYSLDTRIPSMGCIGLPSQASRVHTKRSFVSLCVDIVGTGDIFLNDCEIGAMSTLHGDVKYTKKQVLPFNTFNDRKEVTNDEIFTLIPVLISALVGIFSDICFVFSMYPIYVLGLYIYSYIFISWYTILGVYILMFILQTIFVHPLIFRILVYIYTKRLSNHLWLSSFTVYRYVDNIFLGSPLYTIIMKIRGMKIDWDVLLYSEWRMDEYHVIINHGSIVDRTTDIYAHRYNQRHFETYKMEIKENVLSEDSTLVWDSKFISITLSSKSYIG